MHSCIQKLFRQASKIVIQRHATVPTPTGGKTNAEKVTEKIDKTDKDTKTLSAQEAAKKTEEAKIEELKKLQLKSNPSLTEEQALELAKHTLKNKVDIEYDSWPGSVFLDVRDAGNAAVAVINRDHDFFNKFFDHLQNSSDTKGIKALEVFIMALVRTEDVLFSQFDKKTFDKIRQEWGRYLEEFLEIVE